MDGLNPPMSIQLILISLLAVPRQYLGLSQYMSARNISFGGKSACCSSEGLTKRIAFHANLERRFCRKRNARGYLEDITKLISY